MSITKISILGAGSWGSALAVAFGKVIPITLWSYNKDQVDLINRTRGNVGYLIEPVKFPNNVVATNDLEQALRSELLVIATPLKAFRGILQRINELSLDKCPDIIWVCKGLELQTGLFPHQIAKEILGENRHNVGALMGPSFANEIAQGKPAAVVLSSYNINFTTYWINKLSSVPNLRIYSNNDLIGSEVGGAVKNIMAIAIGISDGLELGQNARAALITRGLCELVQLVEAMGGLADTAYGLTGIGDLILTCIGNLSRNRQVGLELVKGNSLDVTLKNLGHVAEGVPSTLEIHKLGIKLRLNLPIIDCVYSILYKDTPLINAVDMLMSRAPKSELQK